MSKPDGGPAFPSEQSEEQDGKWNQTLERGMTLRDYFAAAALQGYFATRGFITTPNYSPADLAELAYEQADAMLAERDK